MNSPFGSIAKPQRANDRIIEEKRFQERLQKDQVLNKQEELKKLADRDKMRRWMLEGQT